MTDPADQGTGESDAAEHDATLEDYRAPGASDSDSASEASEAASGSDSEPEEAALVDEHDATVDETGDSDAPKKAGRSKAKWAVLAAKVGISVVGLYLVWSKVTSRDGFADVVTNLETLHWGWFAGAIGMQLTAIAFAIERWRTMLRGQGIEATWRFAFPSFMIGRFWGAFTLGGLGLDGWKLFDVGTQTNKYARAVAVTGVEKVLGQLAFGLVVMGASLWGVAFIGTEGVIMINVFFLVLVAAGLTLIAKPTAFRALFRVLPRSIQPRLQTLIDAVCAYHGKWLLLAQAVGFGVAVHAFNNLIYVCAARALGVDLSVGLVFFGSSMTIMVTLVPISINGVGLREAAAVALYTTAAVGLSEAQAVLIPTVGFAAEMLVSITGVLFLLARRWGSVQGLAVVADVDREQKVYAELEPVPTEKLPVIGRGLAVGLGAGLLAGMIVGLTEGAVIVAGSGGRIGYSVLAYGALVYALFCGLGGAFAGFALALFGRKVVRIEAPKDSTLYAVMTGLVVAAFGFALGVFRVRRDVFNEELVLKSKEGLMVLGGCALAAAVLFLVLAGGLRFLTQRKVGAWLLRSWGSPAFVGVLVAATAGAAIVIGEPPPPALAARPAAAEGAPNVLVIVVDTLRADHLPAYGYADGSTPALDRFAEDAVRYDQAFSNASWTRPSFASILTGRYPSSHGVMAKTDALPDDVTTLAESLQGAGYTTGGIVTNFNVEPRYNFDQGFDHYTFLETENVLWADAAGAQLLLIQSLRRVVERARAMTGEVRVESFYQDGATVNARVGGMLDETPEGSPFFAFVGYMDPHDPYFEHPYTGTGYARAAHQHPELEEASRLRELYDGEITYWDSQFGALMDDLRRRGLYDDMMIVVTSDHGEEFGEHGGFWHGTTLYDEQLHVPLFVKLPANERAGTHVSHWVQSIDLMPSILARVGVEVPEGVQGGSLEEGTTRVYAEESHEGNVLESVRELVNFEELKIIVANEGNPRGLEPVELYEVADDRGETTNVAETQRERVRTLLGALDEAREAATEGAVEGQTIERSDEELQMQCRLGYADPVQCCERGFLSGEQCRGT